MVYLVIMVLVLDSIFLYIDRFKLIKQRDNAEQRAVTHFQRVYELEKEEVILLENASEYRNKIVDLENNIEFLFNNLTPTKKELVRPGNQN